MAWRLICDRGQQVWKYLTNENSIEIEFDSQNPNSSDKVFRDNAIQQNSKPLTIDDENLKIGLFKDEFSSSVVESVLNGINYYSSLQVEDGHWPGDYGGPMFLLPGAIITSYITKFEFTVHQKSEIIKYLFNHQLPDGGWGTHIENKSTMFGTVLNYISLRLLGIPFDNERLQNAHNLIELEGGAMYAPSWAKFWLCVLGLMPWEGVNSLFPELWLLPEWLPVHPSRYWCHCRMVYLPMSYIYGKKIIGEITPLIKQLRNELYVEKYENIDFTKHRNSISSLDLYTPQTYLLKILNYFTNTYEMIYNQQLRNQANEFLISYIEAEDEHTNYINIGPVNKFLNMLSIWYAKGRDSKQFQYHLNRVNDYLWLSEDGMKIQGYNGSQLWDTTFSIQAILETGLGHLYSNILNSAYYYLEISQVLEDVRDHVKFYRHISKGGWPFSTRDHGWPITDCTAEGIKSTLLLEEQLFNCPRTITDDRLEYAVNFILSTQNEDGGWASYELQRSGSWIEWLNPAEVFRGIMIDYSYTECTSACIQALWKFRSQKRFSNHRRREIDVAIQRGIEFIKKSQRSDGSWYGSWAICFTYGTWFAIEALITVGESIKSKTITKAIEFLLSKQNSDGGWGESYLSCVYKSYVQHEKSQVVNTSWAVLSLMSAKADPISIRKGIQFLMKSQLSNGDWNQQSISGVFNGNCMISYTNYRNIFPIWALGRFLKDQ
jgi:squalene/oxidosqualene cyclase-like protein